MDKNNIKEKILKLKEQQLNEIKNTSYLNNFYSLINLRNNFNTFNYKKIWKEDLNNEINYLNKHIDSYLGFIEKSIKGSIDLIDLEELLSMRERLYEYSYTIEGYLMELILQREILDSYGVKILAQNSENISIDSMLNLLNSLLDLVEDDLSYYNNINSFIINILPFRITRGNYYDILRNSLKKSLINTSKINLDKRIKYLKKQFDPSLYDGYGTNFIPYFLEIEKIKKLNKKELEKEDIVKKLDDLNNIEKELREILYNIKQLGICNSRNIVISLLDEFEIEEDILSEYNSFLDLMDSKKPLEEYNLRLEGKLKARGEIILEDYIELHDNIEELSEKEEHVFNEIHKELKVYEEVLLYFNDFNFSKIEDLKNIDDEKVSSTYLNLSIEALISSMELNSKLMDNIDRRIRMRKILSLIDLPFKEREDLLEYIEYSLDPKILARGEIEFISNQLIYYLKKEISNIKEGS